MWYYGIAYINLQFTDLKGEEVYNYGFGLMTEGEAAIKNMIKSKSKKYYLQTSNSEKAELQTNYYDFLSFLDKQSSFVNSQTLKIKVSVYFREKLGYEKYGDKIDLVEPVEFSIKLTGDNLPIFGLNATISAVNAQNNSFIKSEKYANPSLIAITNSNFSVENSCITEFKAPSGAKDNHQMPMLILKMTDPSKSMQDIQEEIRKYFISFSNQNGGKSILSSYGINVANPYDNYWHEFFPNGNATIFTKKHNKEFKSEPGFKEVTYGELNGVEMEIDLLEPEKNDNRKFACIYIFKHPKDSTKLIMFYKNFISEYEPYWKEAINNYHEFFKGIKFD